MRNRSDPDSAAEGIISLSRLFLLLQLRGDGGQLASTLLHPRFWVLGMLQRRRRTMTELSGKLHRSKPNMTAIVDALARDGHARRVPSGSDRRIVNVAITQKGREFMRAQRHGMKANVERRLALLGRGDLCALDIAIRRVRGIFAIMEDDIDGRKKSRCRKNAGETAGGPKAPSRDGDYPP